MSPPASVKPFGELSAVVLACDCGVFETPTMVARLLCIILLAGGVRAAEVTRAGRWELHSSYWMSLHQTLMRDASSRTARGGWTPSPPRRASDWGAVLAQ